MLNLKLSATLVLVLALTGASRASIDNSPLMKVTHRNSGPRYDIDDVGRQRLDQAAASAPEGANEVMQPNRPPSGGSSGEHEETPAIGRISIRRIFLVPVMAPNHDEAETSGASDLWGSPSRSSQSGSGGDSEERPVSPFGFGANRPSFWPFMMPPSPRHPHLFGADQASRSPTAESGADKLFGFGEREAPQRTNEGARVDDINPIQALMDLMQQALNQTASSNSNNFFNDLNRAASGDANKKSGAEASNGQEETRDDIVELEGKKYLRKTIINRRQGENMVFMTRRLIFTPLNETESIEKATTEGPSIASSSITPIDSSATSTSSSADQERTKATEEATTTVATSTTGSVTTEAPSPAPTSAAPPSEIPTSEASTSEAPTSTGGSASEAPATESSVEETTPKENLMRRLSETIERAAERLVESVGSSTTEKPIEPPMVASPA